MIGISALKMGRVATLLSPGHAFELTESLLPYEQGHYGGSTRTTIGSD